MKPSQQQSGPEAGANITLATKAGQVESWLAGLPVDDPLESARRLTEYLAAHDRADLPAGFRKQLLDLVSADVRRTLNVLERQFRHMALPMDEVELAHVDRAVGLLGALAEFSKRLLLESGERALHLFGGNPLPVYYSRFLHARLETMDICHLSHRQLPEGFWLDCHRIGLRLLQSGLAETPDLVRTPASLRDLYLALLLEASADPYHLSAQERVWVTDLIARHGALATLEPPASARHSGVFGIRAHQDRPPFPLAWQRNVVPDCDLVLNTAPLVRKLALLISQVERGRAAPEDVPAIRHPGYRDLLQRLKLCWGASTQRTASRHRPAQRSQRTVLIGLPAVHGRLASADAPGDGAEPVACQILNDSSGGMALLVGKPAFRLRIGALVCVCEGQARRDVGLVRWFKTGSGGTLTFGIKLRPGVVAPVLWLPDDGAPATPCLILAPEPGRPAAGHLLVAPGHSLAGQSRLRVRWGECELDLILRGPVDGSAEVDVFRCEPAGP